MTCPLRFCPKLADDAVVPFWYKQAELFSPIMVHGGIVMEQEAKRGGRHSIRLGRVLGMFSLTAGIVTATAAAAGSFLFSICPQCTGYRINEVTPEPAGEREKQPDPEGKSRVQQSQLSPLRQDLRRAG
jgi:hypothetical protein